MTTTITESELLKSIIQLVVKANVSPEISELEWMSDLFYMHKRRWLYCSMKGSKLAGVLGAFRLPVWDEKFLHSMPDKEEGTVLYIPFIVTTEELSVVPYRLIRFCLKENPGIKEIVYFKKRWSPGNQKSFKLVRKTLVRASRRALEEIPVLAAH